MWLLPKPELQYYGNHVISFSLRTEGLKHVWMSSSLHFYPCIHITFLLTYFCQEMCSVQWGWCLAYSLSTASLIPCNNNWRGFSGCLSPASPYFCFLFFSPAYLTAGQMKPDEIWFKFFVFSSASPENFFSTFLVLHTKYKQVMSYVFVSVQAMCIWLSRQLQALVFPIGFCDGVGGQHF